MAMMLMNQDVDFDVLVGTEMTQLHEGLQAATPSNKPPSNLPSTATSYDQRRIC